MLRFPRMWALAALFALAACHKTAAPAGQTVPVAVPAPTEVQVDIAQAATLHTQLLADAAKVPQPTPPVLAPTASALPPVVRAGDALPAPTAPELTAQVVIAFTANVIGEIDPCG